MRVGATACVVLTAFARLPAPAFVDFAKFHVSLGLASFIECFAAIERAGAAEDKDGRRSLATVSTLLAWAMMAVSWVALWWHPRLAGIGFGASVALLAIPEAARLRAEPARAARNELIAVGAFVAGVGASWLLPGLSTRGAMTLLAAGATIPRLAVSVRRTIPKRSDYVAAFRVAKTNIRPVGRFMVLQGIVPIVSGAPAYLLPSAIGARNASWVLLALRASGLVSAALQRQMVTTWVSLSGRAHEAPRWRSVMIGYGGALTVSCAVGVALPPYARTVTFAVFTAGVSAAVTVLSTRMNARGSYLSQVGPFALLWAGASVSTWCASARFGALPLEAFLVLHSACGVGAVGWFFRMLCSEPRRSARESSEENIVAA